MKGKRVIAGILLAGILAVTLAGCKNTDNTKEETEKPVITLGSDNYPPYNYLNEDGIPTGIDVELATEAFKRMGYQVEVVQINWEKKKELVDFATNIFALTDDFIMECFCVAKMCKAHIFKIKGYKLLFSGSLLKQLSFYKL